MNNSQEARTITWEEYACITNRIIAAYQVKHSYIIAMYTITIAIVGYAIQAKNAWLFLLPYIVLFSFQRLIQNERYRINKFDAFLAVYSEDIWEREYKEFHDNLKLSYRVHEYGIITSKFVRVPALHLGVACSGMAILMQVYSLVYTSEGYDLNRLITHWTFWDILLLTIACVLLILIVIWCKNANDSEATRAKYIEQIRQQNHV